MRSSDKNTENALPDPTLGWSEAVKQAAVAQLARILESPQFRTSKRCSQFLRYVVEQANENRLEYLKERTLGIEVFGRAPQYDTNQDPVVRAAAGEVRKRLAQYYLEPGHEDELRISLPAGSYVPEVNSPSKIKAEAAPRPYFRIKYIGIAAAVVAMVATAVLLSLRFRKTDLDRFWAPVIEPQESVLVCIGQPKTYNFNSKAQGELDEWFANGTEKQNPPPGLATLSLEDVVPMWDRYIALADAQAFSHFSELIAQKGKKAQLRGVRSVSLADLSSRPCVLIGAFNNEWTMSLAGELRFYFDIDHQNKAEIVRDRQNPGQTEWKVVNSWPHWRIPTDYAIVSRVFNPTTGQAVVIAAGITQYGTHAAGEFITNQAYFSEALSQAPRDWYRKNVQVVLSTKVVSGTHGPPKVLAVHFW
jgi:hypothetical protein